MAVENWPVGWFFCKLLRRPWRYRLDDGSNDRLIRRHQGRGVQFVPLNGRNAYKRSDSLG